MENEIGQFTGNDSLEGLGLVDPATGRALPTPDWQPGSRPPASDDALRQQRQEAADPDPAFDADRAGTAGLDWDSDANPYKAEALRARQAQNPGVQARQQFETQVATIDSQAQAAFSQLVASGLQPEVAQALVGAARQAAVLQAQLQADRLALLPAAKREVAERIAREFSLPNAKIDPSEILQEGSVEAMRARAKTLQEARRGQSFQARMRAGADRVERGTGPGTRIDYDNLSPLNTIKLGILRGQFSS